MKSILRKESSSAQKVITEHIVTFAVHSAVQPLNKEGAIVFSEQLENTQVFISDMDF